MTILNHEIETPRYAMVSEEKAGGTTYTPQPLSDFVAERIIEIFDAFPVDRPLRVLDPAIGDGQLLVSLLERLRCPPELTIEIYGFETDQKALYTGAERIRQRFPYVTIRFEHRDFLDFVLELYGAVSQASLFNPAIPELYDLVIANPPYVRTQIIGAKQAQILSRRFGLSGRVDLYYAFILAMAQVLKPQGIAGIIVSNRFMSTRSGTSIRRALLEQFALRHIWDLGDTKLFRAAVLPAVLLAQGRNGNRSRLPEFTSIYETHQSSEIQVESPIQALLCSGIVQVNDGRRFLVQQGRLDTAGTPGGVWRLATKAVDSWLARVKSHTWGTFRNIGKVRVGVKTCADKVFIRSDWHELSEAERPELLRPLITHHVARRFKGAMPECSTQILYPHESVLGYRRAADLSRYPHTKAYLEHHRNVLESRRYVLDAGREWYEIWVPQDPSAWDKTKLVFRDIAEEPTFWIDQAGSVVNGDCYWIICDDPDQTDLLWLAAAVGNSRFIERFYDICFNNKLYAGRRRFITQYVEEFPLPNPNNDEGKEIIAKAKEIYTSIPSAQADSLQEELERMIWNAFGLTLEEVTG